MTKRKLLVLCLAAVFCPVLIGAQAAAQMIAAPTETPSPAPTPTRAPITMPRGFHCNCFAAGHPVVWAGNVQASSYFQARQLATASCLGALRAMPQSPLFPTPGAGFGALIPTPVPPMFSPCSNCACN